jgi:hypothetical protein
MLLHLCINFQRQIPNNEGAVKKNSDGPIARNLSEIFLFLHINYNEFNLKNLYTDVVR